MESENRAISIVLSCLVWGGAFIWLPLTVVYVSLRPMIWLVSFSFYEAFWIGAAFFLIAFFLFRVIAPGVFFRIVTPRASPKTPVFGYLLTILIMACFWGWNVACAVGWVANVTVKTDAEIPGKIESLMAGSRGCSKYVTIFSEKGRLNMCIPLRDKLFGDDVLIPPGLQKDEVIVMKGRKSDLVFVLSEIERNSAAEQY